MLRNSGTCKEFLIFFRVVVHTVFEKFDYIVRVGIFRAFVRAQNVLVQALIQHMTAHFSIAQISAHALFEWTLKLQLVQNSLEEFVQDARIAQKASTF